MMAWRSAAPVAALAARDQELAAYRVALAAVAEVCERAAAGDLEARIAPVGDDPELRRIRNAVNHLVDVADGFVREAGASLAAASEGRFERQFLGRGMPGSFRHGADLINGARGAMQASAAQVDDQERTRAELADTVFGVSEHVAAASTELSASADSLTGSARAAVGEASTALDIVRSLERSSDEIQEAVLLIRQVAKQTRLLALNATIEAVRAGEAGEGFAVVAGEVKALADEAAASSGEIERQVAAARRAATEAVTAIGHIAGTIGEMDQQVDAIAQAAGGDGGLASMAEQLREEMGAFVSTVSTSGAPA
jgi:methyl-accepting chemotaxis protein